MNTLRKIQLFTPHRLTLLYIPLTKSAVSSFYIFIIHHCKTPFHHCPFSVITAHFVHHCTLKQALSTFIYHAREQKNKNEKQINQ